MLTVFIFYQTVYGYTTNDQFISFKSRFHQKLELAQNNVTLAIRALILSSSVIFYLHGSSKEEFFEELDLESVQQRPWVLSQIIRLSGQIHLNKQVIVFLENTAQKMKFSINDFFKDFRKLRIWSHLATEEILNGKLHFLRSKT